VRSGNVHKISIDSLRFRMLGRMNPRARERRNEGIISRGGDGVGSWKTKANDTTRRPAIARTTDGRSERRVVSKLLIKIDVLVKDGEEEGSLLRRREQGDVRFEIGKARIGKSRRGILSERDGPRGEIDEAEVGLRAIITVVKIADAESRARLA
jgi:hypothetical protein